MKQKILLIALITLINFNFVNGYYEDYPSANSDETEDCCGIYDAYRYGTLGVGPVIFIPNIGVGYRERHAKLGWDSSISFSTIGYAHQLSAHLVGHYYFNQARQNSPYIGLGILGSGFITNHKEGGGTFSMDVVFGKELKKSDKYTQFIEMHVACPTLWIGHKHNGSFYLPLLYVKYGISF